MPTTLPPDQVFYIASQINTYEQPYVLDIQDSDPDSGTPIITWPQKTTDAQNELWSMTSDGLIISQLNGYALTLTDSSSGAGIVAQPVADPSNLLQLWNVTSDGYIENQQNPNLVLTAYANDPYGHQVLVQEKAESAENYQQWTLVPPGQVFYVTSAIPGQPPYVLDIQGSDMNSGTPIITWPQKTTDVQNELWTMTSDGHIMSQWLTWLALTPTDSSSGAGIVVQPVADPSNLLQRWTVTSDGYIENQQNPNLVLTAADQPYDNQISLQEKGESDWAAQRWTTVPSTSLPSITPRPNWVYFQSALTDNQGNTCVLNVSGASTNPGTQLIFWPLQENSSNEMWQITPDGRILSALGNNLVLTLGPANDGGGHTVTVNTQQNPLPLTQVWDLSTPNQIRSASSGEFLVPAGGTEGPIEPTDGTPILAASGTPNLSYTWYTVPSLPLDAIMMLPPVPFPAFTGEEATAYVHILNKLPDVSSLRAEYANLDVTLSDYLATINTTERPDHISQSAWKAVKRQLRLEITYADATRDLFNNYQNFHTDLFTNSQALLNQLISDARITEGGNDPSVGGIMLAIFEGLAYTGLSDLGGGFAVVGNLMEMGVNIALAASGSGSNISPNPFQVAVSELWENLSNNFGALLKAMGNMEVAILKDWGKLHSVYALTQKQGGGDSLYWDPNTTGDLVAAAQPGYKISVMQMLMPAKYQVYQSDQSDDIPDNVPDYALWQPTASSPTYWIAERGNPDVYPSEQAMQGDIWNNGVTQAEFFLSGGGWGFSTANMESYGSYYLWCMLTFSNLTPNELEITITDDDNPKNPSVTCSISPYESLLQIVVQPSQHTFPSDVSIQINDMNNIGLSPVAQLGLHIHQPLKEGAEVTITSQNTLEGYAFTSAIINQGSYSWNYTASVQIGLTQN